MTVNTPRTGSVVSDAKRIVLTTPTMIYRVVGRSRPILNSIHLCNVSAGDVTVTVHWYKADDASNFAIIAGVVLPIAGRGSITDLPLCMRENDEIRVTASEASAIDAIIVVVESTGASQ